MQYRTLGRTGLRVSVMGIGAGGPSRLGQRDNIRTENESVDLVLRGIDAGINFIDTAEAYRTEDIVGAAVPQRDRSQIIISTKKRLRGENITREELRAGLHDSLRRLRADYIDIYHLHGLKPDQYDYYLQEIAPAMQNLQREGKIRFLGVTENWSGDLAHQMLARAIQDGVWDVIMVGFNLLNQHARESVLRPAIEHDIGVLIMFAVRRALSQPAKLKSTLEQLIESGEIDASDIDLDNPLGFLIESGAAASIPDAAYRFTRDEPGAHVILSGTGNPQHLDANLATFAHPPLPPEITARLKHIFRKSRSVTGG
ncbi:MAG: aldo/keto reductase [Chloroflexota bacterium]|nr:aldo/keto reductase [Chloroflexota bacterium]